jgi:transposase InsO family protein
MIARDFVDRGTPVGLVLGILQLSASVFYYQNKTSGRKGAPLSTHTSTIWGTRLPNEIVTGHIIAILEEEFVDYGYKKVTYALRQNFGYIISAKKVYRLMKESKLLSVQIPRNRGRKTWITDFVPNPKYAFHHLEMDIKYMWVAGAGRNAFLFTIIDVYSRLNMVQLVAWSITKVDLVGLLSYVIDNYQIPKTIYVRSDNGSQFESGLVRDFLTEKGIQQEFTRPGTPEQNGHMEAYHSIVERVICRQYEFKDLPELQQTMDRFQYFYNFRRIHSGIGNQSPMRWLQQNGYDANSINEDFNRRGWRLGTTANKPAFDAGMQQTPVCCTAPQPVPASNKKERSLINIKN